MRPHLASIMSGTAACRQWKVPVRLTAIMRSHASAVMSRNSVKPSIPALVTMISTGPKAERTSSRAVSMAARSLTSTTPARAVPPEPVISAGHRGGGVAVDVEHADPVAPLGQLAADGPAHAGPTTGDDCDAAHRRPLLAMRASPSFSASTSPNGCR